MKLPYHCWSFWLIAGIGMERIAQKREPKRAGPLTQKQLYETRGLRRFRLQVSLGKDLLTLAFTSATAAHAQGHDARILVQTNAGLCTAG